MKELTVEDKLSDWVRFRNSLVNLPNPLQATVDFWSTTPLIAFNNLVDPYNYRSWPTPWEIIDSDRYDDLTLAIMIGYTIKLTDRFKDSQVEIRIMVDQDRTRLYNLVYVDNQYVLNYQQDSVSLIQDIPVSFFLENVVELVWPR
jgi:hypothetical protein